MFMRKIILVLLCVYYLVRNYVSFLFFFFNIQKINYCVLFNGSKYIVQKHSAGGLLLNLCVSSLLVEWRAMTVCL